MDFLFFFSFVWWFSDWLFLYQSNLRHFWIFKKTFFLQLYKHLKLKYTIYSSIPVNKQNLIWTVIISIVKYKGFVFVETVKNCADVFCIFWRWQILSINDGTPHQAVLYLLCCSCLGTSILWGTFTRCPGSLILPACRPHPNCY